MDYSKNITDSECSLDKYYFSSKQETSGIPPVYETSNIGNRSENVEALEEFKKMGLGCVGCQDYQKVAELQEKKNKIVNTTASIGYSGSSEPIWEIESEVGSKRVKPRATVLRLTQKGHMEEGVSRSSVKVFASKSEKRKKRKEETVDPRVTLGLIGRGQIETATRADYYIDQVEKSKAFASAGKENRLADKASLKTAPLIGPVSTYGVIVETKKGDNQNQIGKSFQMETIRQPLLQKPKSSERICMRKASTHVECFSKSADVTEKPGRGSHQTEAAEEAEHCSGIAENKTCHNKQAKMQNKNQHKSEVSSITRNALEASTSSSTDVTHACGEEDQENVQLASELDDYEKHFLAKLARSDVATSKFVEKYLLSSRKFAPSLELSEFKECEETARPALTKGRTIENIAASLTEDGMEPRSANQNGLDISVVPVKCVGQGGTDCAIENTQELGRLDITSSHCKDNISSQTVSNGSQTVVSPALEYAPVGTIIKKQRKASCKKQRRIERNQRIENGDTILIHESQSLKRPRVEGADSVVENSKKLRTERVIPVKPSSLGISRVAHPRPFPKCHVSEHKNKPLEISGVALPRPFPKCHVSENENKSLEVSGVALPRPFPKCHVSEHENEPSVHEEGTAHSEASTSEKNILKCGRISSTEGESSSTSVSGNMSEAVTNGLAKPRISIDKSMPTRIPLRIKKCMQLPLENITKAHIKRIKKWYKMGTWNDVLNKHEMKELSTNISPGKHDPSGHVWSKQQVPGVPFIPAFILDKLEALKQLSRDELTKGQRVAVNKWQKLLNKKNRLENQHMEQMKQIKSQSVKRAQAEDSDSIRRVSKKSRTKVNTAPTRSSLETAGVVDGISKPSASDHPEISSMKDIHKQTSIEGSICEDTSRELSSSVSKMLVSSISTPNKVCGGNSQSNSSAKPATVTLSTEKSNHLCGDVSNHEADETISSSMPPAPCQNVHVCQIVGHPAGSSGSEEYISTQLEIKSAQVVNGSEASISAKPTGVDQFGSLKAVSLHQDVSSCVRNAEESSLRDQKLTSCTGNVLKSSESKSTGYAAGSGRTSKVSVSAEAAGTCSQFGPPQELDSLIELILKYSEDGDGYSSKTPDISVSAKTTGTTPQFSYTEASSRVQELDNSTDYITRSTEEMRCPVETVVISDSARLVDPHTQPATATALLPELGIALEKVPKPTDGTSKTDTGNSIGTTAACVSSKPVESYDKLDSSKVAELLEDATVCIENISKSAETYSQVGSPKASGVTEGLSSCLENKLKPVQDPAAEGASTGSALSVSAKPVDTCSQFVSPQELNSSTEHMVKPAEDESTGYSCSKMPVMSVSAKITGSTSQSTCTVAAGLVHELRNPTDCIISPTEEVNYSAETSVISDSTKLADQSATVAGLLSQLDNAIGQVPQPTDSTSVTGTSSSVETTAACISSEPVETYSEPGSSNAARLLEEQSVCIENISKSKEGAPCASSHSSKNFSQVGSSKASRPPEEQGAITESSSVSVPISEFKFKVTKPLQESRGFIGNTSKPSQDICASTADASSSLETLAICVFDKPEGTCSQSGITTQTGLIQEPTSSLLKKLKSITEGVCSSVERSSLIVCDESVDTYSHFDSARKIRPLHESIESVPRSAGDTSTEDTSSTVAMSEASDSAIPGGAYFDLDPDKIAGLIQELDDCINEILNPAEETSNSVEASVTNMSAKSEDTYSQAGRVENMSKPLGDGSKEDTSNSSSCLSNKSAETYSQMVFPNLTGPLPELDSCIEKLSKNCMSKEAATTSMETSAVFLSAKSSDTCSQVGNVEAEEPFQNFKVCIGNASKPTEDATRSVETSAEYVPEENISKLPECKSGTVPSSDVGISATSSSAKSKEPLQKQKIGIENIPKLTEDAISSVRTLAESVSANSTDTCYQVGFAQRNGPAQESKTSIENFLRPTKDTSTSASTSSVGKVTEFVSAKRSDISFNSKPLTESESVRNTDRCVETSVTPIFSELAAKHGQFCFVKEIELHQGETSCIANTPKATENKSDNILNPCLTCLEKDFKNPAESFEEATIAGKDISKLPECKYGTVPSSDVGISAVPVSVNSSDTYSQLGPVEPEESIRKLNVGIQDIPKRTEDPTSPVRTSAESVSAKSGDTCSQVSLGKTNGPAEESYTSIEKIAKPTKDTSTSASTSSVGNVTEFVSSESTRNTGSCAEISITPSFSELAVKHDQFCFVKKIELLQGETGPTANTPNATQNNFDNNIASPCLTHTVNPAGSVEEVTIAGEDIATLLECKSGAIPSSDEGISAVPVYAKSSDTYSQLGPIEAKDSLQKLEDGIENISKPKEDATTSLRTSTESVSVNSADTGSQVSLVNTNGPVQELNISIENISRLKNDTSTSDSTSPVGKVTEFVSAKPSDISSNTKPLTESESIRNTDSCKATSSTPSFSELAAKHGQFSFVKEIELLQGETSRIAKTPDTTQNNFVNNIANPCLTHTGKDSANPAGTIAGEDISKPPERKSGTVASSEIGISVVPVSVKEPNALPQCSFAEAARQLQSVRVSAVADRTAVNLEETSVPAKPLVATDETVKTPVAPVQEVNTCKDVSKPVMSKSEEAASTSETKSVTAAKKAPSATVDTQKGNQSRKRRHDTDTDGPGDIKRQRTKASLCPYRVAVVDKGYPEVILTRDQSDAIEMELADRLEKATRFDASATYQFSNCSYAGGVLWICCEDERTKVWLKRNIARMSTFWRGIRLKAVDEADLPVRLKVMVFVPDHEPELKKFITCLDRENPGLTASNWHLIGKKSEDGGVIFAFTIDDNSYAMLENNDWQVSYKRTTLECKIMHRISDMWEYTSDGAGSSGTSKSKGREGNDKGYPGSWRNAHLKQSRKKKRYGNVRSFGNSIQVPYNGFLRF